MKSSWDKKNTNSHTDSNITILIITSNVNGLNTPIKGRDCQSGERKKQDPTKCCQCTLSTKSQTVKSKKMGKSVAIWQNRKKKMGKDIQC